jgi:hypothetical protein
MANAFHIDPTPILIDLGAAGKASVKASVPFAVGTARYCAGFVHRVGDGRRKVAVFRGLTEAPAGVLRVWHER